MRTLWLSHEQALTIAQHALADHPAEACGMIGGRGSVAHVVVPLPNAAADPLRQYVIEPQALVRTLYDFERTGLALIGIYHSHPDGEPRPSPTDIREAAYPETAYLIVGVRQGETRFAAWQINREQVLPLELHIGGDKPEAEHSTLTRAQIIAILISALIAFAIMLSISLSLLPPAPDLLR